MLGALAGPPILAVFLDGLGFAALERMPFLAAQPSVRRLRTELGYSITCHASMYTGVRPDRHLLWFLWQRGPQTSPFRWTRSFSWLSPVDNLPLHLLATRIARRLTPTTSWFGIPNVVHLPWRYFPELDLSERRLWSEPGYLSSAPTIFDHLRQSGVPFEIVGMDRERAEGLSAVVRHQPDPRQRLTYLFIGDVDHASHAHGQDSPGTTAVLREIDRQIQREFEQLQRQDPQAVLIAWSDHGHHDVQRVDPFEVLAEHHVSLARHLHVIDTNFIRAWIDDPAERADVAAKLNAMGIGFTLDDATLERYRCRMPDDRYGNLLFYLDLPYAFSRTIWGFGRRLASGHGYLPDYPGSDGVLCSSLPVQPRELALVDIAPSVLALTDIPAPAGLDGRSFWAG
jgi:Type I phosphodiesterase / nucleotide pyrophosphatase